MGQRYEYSSEGASDAMNFWRSDRRPHRETRKEKEERLAYEKQQRFLWKMFIESHKGDTYYGTVGFSTLGR